MSDLQLSLVALGVLIIVAVMLFNWWQERQIGKLPSNLNQIDHDALMSDVPSTVEYDEDAMVVTRKVIESENITTPSNAEVNNNVDYMQNEPSFQVSHQPEQYEGEHTLDQSSSTWEMLSGQNDIENTSRENTSEENTHELVQEVIANASDVHAENDQLQTGEASASELELSSPKKSVTVELTEEELDILNIVPAAPASFVDKTTVDSLTASNDSAEPVPYQDAAKEHVVAVAHHEQAISLRHDGLPTQIIDEIDHAGVIVFAQPVSSSVLDALNTELSALGKPIQAFGLTVENAWASLTDDSSRFQKVVYALQVADRSGPTSKITLHRFQSAIEAHAKKLSAQVNWHGHADPYAYSVDLDGFCVQVDQLIRFHLIQSASGPFTGTKFRGLAESSGLTLGDNGAFHYINDHGQTLFSIVNADNNPFNAEMLRNIGLRGVNFELDIPRVANSTEAFNLMIMAAKKMEASLFAQLVDDNQRALSDVHIEKIRQQLRVINSQMVARGILPGSLCALRLFS